MWETVSRYRCKYSMIIAHPDSVGTAAAALSASVLRELPPSGAVRLAAP